MSPLLLLLGGGAAVATVVKLSQKAAFQVTSTTSPDGIPIKVAVPVPSSANRQQVTGKSTTPPATSAIVANKVPNRGTVYSPPKAIQPDASGDPQPAPIVISPTGSSSMAVGSVRDVQRALNTLGYLPLLKDDGKLGPATIANVKAFQSKSGLAVDGNAGPATKSALSAAVSHLAGAAKAPIAAAANSAVANDHAAPVNWADFFMPQNQSKVGPAFSPATANVAVPPAITSAPPLDTKGALTMTAADVQKNLNILGAKPALKVDGNIGPMSVAAIKSFQATHGLAADGVAGPKTKTALYIAVNAPKP